MKTNTLEQPSLQVPRDYSVARFAVNAAIGGSESPEGVMQSINPGGEVYLPDTYVGGKDFALPSTAVETYRGHEAIMVPLYVTNSGLQRLYSAASKNRIDRVNRMTYEMAVRILDTSGADGLHHMHGTSFPYTVFYNTRLGGLQVYMTSLGNTRDERQNSLPVLGVIGATGSPKDELALLKLIGGKRIKGRR
jgi:hypothetical protein